MMLIENAFEQGRQAILANGKTRTHALCKFGLTRNARPGADQVLRLRILRSSSPRFAETPLCGNHASVGSRKSSRQATAELLNTLRIDKSSPVCYSIELRIGRSCTPVEK
jgi:hypothetical protein